MERDCIKLVYFYSNFERRNVIEGLYSFECSTYIVDAIKIYSIMNFIFKYFSFIGILSFAYFCVLMWN